MERVSVINGSANVILVVPHGADDNYTTDIVEECATAIPQLQMNAVINRGFERAIQVDVLNDKANCNLISHVKQDVVRDEFLEPLRRIRNRLERRIIQNYWTNPLAKEQKVLVLYIHGAGDLVNKQAGELVSVVVGVGEGRRSNSLTCDLNRRNRFINCCMSQFPHPVYCAEPGGKFAGRGVDNMNQYYRREENDPIIESMQLEFPFFMRKDPATAQRTGASLALAIGRYLNELSQFPNEVVALYSSKRI